MGKAKKTRKFAEVKRLINPKDIDKCVCGAARRLGGRAGSAASPLTAALPCPRRRSKKEDLKSKGKKAEVRHV